MKKSIVIILSAFISIISSCSFFGENERESFDYIKEILLSYRQELSKQGNDEDSRKKFIEDFYSKYEGEKIQLNNFAILAITKIKIENNTETNDALLERGIPKFRLHLAPFKTLNDKNISFGSLYKMKSSIIENSSTEYMEANTFSPIDMVDSDLKGVIITADIYDENLIKEIEKNQTVFIGKELYSNSMIDSIKTSRGITDNWASDDLLGLNFILNKVDLIVEFPKYIENFEYRPIGSTHLSFNVKEIVNLEKLESSGRTLFEKHYSCDYKKLKENAFKLMAENLNLDNQSFIKSGNTTLNSNYSDFYEEDIKYLTGKPADMIFNYKSISHTRIFENGCDFWRTYANILGIKQKSELKEKYTENSLSIKGAPDTYNGSLINGQPYNGIYYGNFPEELMSNQSLFGMICVNNNTKASFKVLRNTMLLFGYELLGWDGTFKFEKGNCIEMSFINVGKELNSITYKFSPNGELNEINCSIINGSCTLNKESKQIIIEQLNTTSGSNKTTIISTSTGEMVNGE